MNESEKAPRSAYIKMYAFSVIKYAVIIYMFANEVK